MRLQPSYRIISCALALLLSACSVRGPLTKAYLKAVEKRQAELRLALGKLPLIIAPLAPVPPAPGKPKPELLRYRRQVDEFKREQIEYLSAMMKRSEELDRLYGEFEGQLGSLATADVDPAAVALVRKRIGVVGTRRKLVLAIGALARAEKARAARNPNAPLGRAISGALVGFLMDPVGPEGALIGAAKGLGSEIKAEQAQDQDIARRLAAVQTALEGLKADVADYQTARADFLAKVQTEYPKEDWGFLHEQS